MLAVDGAGLAQWGAAWPMSGETVRSVAVQPDGYVFVGGGASGDVDFGGGVAHGDTFGSFFAGFDAGGVHRFSYVVGGLGAYCHLDDAAAIPGGGIVVTGTFESSWSVDVVTLAGAPGAGTGFVATLDGAGHVLAARALPMESSCSLRVATGASGAATVWSVCPAGIDFGAGFVGQSGTDALLVAHFGPEGNLAWTRVLPLAEAKLVVGAGGAIVLAGAFDGTIDLGAGSLESAGAADLVLARIDETDGATVWSQRFGGSAYEAPRGVAVDPSGGIVVTGVDLTPESGDSGNHLTVTKLLAA